MGQFACNFNSYSLGRAVTVSVILPTATMHDGPGARHTPKAKYPVLYLLHGGGNDFSTWLRYTSIERYAEERCIAVVTFSAENKSFRDTTVRIDGMTEDSAPGMRENFTRFFLEELPEFVTGIFPISSRPEDTYIAGLSMGGYGTAYYSFTWPERFMAAGLFSAMFCSTEYIGKFYSGQLGELTKEQALQGVFPEFLEAIAKARDEHKRFPRFYISNGAKDLPYFSPAMADLLEESGAEVTRDIGNKPYGHEWAFWDITVREFLDWLPRTDAYAGRGIRGI